MNRLISIIIPVKDGEKYLEEAIAGIKDQHMNAEIIVVDDASTDRTAEIAEKLGCIVLHHDVCRGQVAGKNTGLDIAKGDYILFHDADDVMREGSLKKLYEALEENNEISAVMAQVHDFISPDLSNEEAASCEIKKEPFFGLFTGAVLIRRSAFDITGKFDENINTGEIIDWKAKMDKCGLVLKKLDFVSTNRRIHNSNFGKTNRNKEYQDYLSVLRARLASKKVLPN